MPRRLRPVALSLSLILGAAGGLLAAPFQTIATPPGGTLDAAHVVLDIRDEDTCLDVSPANARCLPAAWVLGTAGADQPIGFHALRWLLGTLGLSGDETVVIYAGAEPDDPDAAWSIGGLVYLAGQSAVLIHSGPGNESAEGGEPRALFREAIYTAPMRTGLMTPGTNSAGDLRQALAEFAKGGGTLSVPPLH